MLDAVNVVLTGDEVSQADYVAAYRQASTPAPKPATTPPTEKFCSRCRQVLPISAFASHKRDGFQSRCKECTRDAARQRRALVAATRAPRPSKPKRTHEEKAAAQRQWRRENRAKIRARAYGLTEEDVRQLRDAQAGLCAVCHTALDEGRRQAIDHCHDTDLVRGLLCFNCNTGIGKLGDNAAGVRRALEFLERFESSPEYLAKRGHNHHD